MITVQNDVTELNQALRKQATRQVWRCTDRILRTAGYKKKKHSSSQICPMKCDANGEAIKYDTQWGEAKIKETVDQQTQLIKHMKDKKCKELYAICVVIDDFNDNPPAMKRAGGI